MGRIATIKNLGTFSAVGQTDMVKSGPFRNQGFTIVTTGFSGTIKFIASNSDMNGTAPDLSASASSANEYSTTQSIDLQNGNTIQGDTGVAYTADTSVTRYEINDNNNQWVGIQVTAVTAGTVELRLNMTDNQ